MNSQYLNKENYLDYAYQILNSSIENSNEQIRAEYLKLAKKAHPDKSTNMHDFHKIKSCYDLLANNRSAYDTWLNSGILIEYEKWSGSNHTFVHWTTNNTTSKRLETKDYDIKDARLKFRNYEI